MAIDQQAVRRALRDRNVNPDTLNIDMAELVRRVNEELYDRLQLIEPVALDALRRATWDAASLMIAESRTSAPASVSAAESFESEYADGVDAESAQLHAAAIVYARSKNMDPDDPDDYVAAVEAMREFRVTAEKTLAAHAWAEAVRS